jgi:putative transposase
MKYDPAKHHRRSIRLKGYDYTRAGLYFITLCCQNRACLFGYIPVVGADLRIGDPGFVGADLRVCPKMILNPAGQMIERWYYELQNKFPDIKCHEMVVMPNHFHCIIEIVGCDNAEIISDLSEIILGEHKGSPLHRVVQWFKTMSTNEYIRGVKNLGWRPFNGKLWQRNYYEHIIRNEPAYYRISEYIRNNPAKWAADKFHGK